MKFLHLSKHSWRRRNLPRQANRAERSRNLVFILFLPMKGIRHVIFLCLFNLKDYASIFRRNNFTKSKDDWMRYVKINAILYRRHWITIICRIIVRFKSPVQWFRLWIVFQLLSVTYKYGLTNFLFYNGIVRKSFVKIHFTESYSYLSR